MTTTHPQIKSSLEYRTLDSWNEASLSGDFSLTTPFDAVKTLSVMAQMKQKTTGKEGTLTVERNDKNVLDVSGEYNSENKHMASLTFTHPQPMQFTASGTGQDLDLYANWDK